VPQIRPDTAHYKGFYLLTYLLLLRRGPRGNQSQPRRPNADRWTALLYRLIGLRDNNYLESPRERHKNAALI